MTSSIDLPLSVLALCSPRAHLMASIRFDFPEPFGPTMAVTPSGKVSVTLSMNDLKPMMSSFFSFMISMSRLSLAQPRSDCKVKNLYIAPIGADQTTICCIYPVASVYLPSSPERGLMRRSVSRPYRAGTCGASRDSGAAAGLPASIVRPFFFCRAHRGRAAPGRGSRRLKERAGAASAADIHVLTDAAFSAEQRVVPQAAEYLGPFPDIPDRGLG